MTLFDLEAIRESLFYRPLADGCDELRVLSGYASPNALYDVMAQDAMHRLRVQVIVGMVVTDGISLGGHYGFLAAQTRDFLDRVDVRYVVAGSPVHAKVYLWMRQGAPDRAFVGSANFTPNGLRGGYLEALAPADPGLCLAQVGWHADRAIGCTDSDLPVGLLTMSDQPSRSRAKELHPAYRPWQSGGCPSCEISLLQPKSATRVAYGLNWGQRPGRDRDQAYLPVTATIAHSGFLPARGQRFTLLAPDGTAMSAVVAQDGNKAIETPDSNALLGRFLRRQFGISPGAAITEADLLRAGATSYRLYRIDEGTYALEFFLR